MMWNWEVQGSAIPSSPGSAVWEVSDSGTVEADGSGAAIAELLRVGPFWDLLDQEWAVTITLTPSTTTVAAQQVSPITPIMSS